MNTNAQKASSFDKALAKVCAHCLVCRQARRQRRGFAFWLVKRVENRLCPFCRVYERVYGRLAHEGLANHDSFPQAGTPTS